MQYTSVYIPEVAETSKASAESVFLMSETSVQERRNHPRGTVLLSGSVRFPEHHLDCAVLDISFTGAKLELDRPLEPHDEVEGLRFSQSEVMPVEVAWKDGVFIGIHFRESPETVALILEPLLPEDCFSR